MWYLILLASSHAVIAMRSSAPQQTPGPSRTAGVVELSVPAMTDAGPDPRRAGQRLTAVHWPSKQPPTPDRPPVLLLHGSPSPEGGNDFKHFAPELAHAGYNVYALDFPGFGGSQRRAPSYSILANAHLALAAMDELNIQRAHVIGWSQGGGTGLHMADLAPDRVASLTLMASIGVQEAEGSGDYYFEHGKYAVGFVALLGLAELTPHFGAIGPWSMRHAFLRNFWDTDQRPLRAVMERLTTPTLVLHGRADFLVPAWGAEESHRLIGPSRLVILDASHFLPMAPPMQRAEVLREVVSVQVDFLERQDHPGGIHPRGSAVFRAQPAGAEDARIGTFHVRRGMQWWFVILVIVAATFISEDLTVIMVGLLIVGGHLDWGVGLAGCFIGIVVGDYGLWALGRFVGRRILRWPLLRRIVTEKSVEKWGRVLDAHPAKTVFLSRCLPGTRTPTYIAAGILARRSHVFLFWVTMAVVIWTPFLLLMTALIGPPLLGIMREVFHGPWAYLVAFAIIVVIVRIAGYEATHTGRQRLKADLARIRRIEFWPMWLFYLPLVPWFIALALRYRGPMTFTCINPGIPAGGGVVGESKWLILRSLSARRDLLLHAVHIPAGQSPDERAALALEAIRTDAGLGGFPVILKPDSGERGHGLRLAHDDADVLEFFQSMTRDALVQRYHPGPHEVGILWHRVPSDGRAIDDCPGKVFSITRKQFPVIEGDGRRTLELLIWDHPRYRMQAAVFLKRHEDQTDRVLALGETMRLGVAGNHCQGTKFYDGADLITPQLEAAIEEVAQSFVNPETGGRLDYGRFDVRYTTEDDLRAGRNLAIIELNGTMSESTNMYDPARTAWWTYSVLYAQWLAMFRLGAIRRRNGRRPMTLQILVRAIRAHFKGRPGSPVAD